MLLNAILENFDELTDLLRQLPDEEFAAPCEQLHEASIGEHIRHIVEMYQALEAGYDAGAVEYDRRARSIALQTCVAAALAEIDRLRTALDKPNRPLLLKTAINGSDLSIVTDFQRELLYNLEHSIHHQALIKVALREKAVRVSPYFGIARSTIQFRGQCAQ